MIQKSKYTFTMIGEERRGDAGGEKKKSANCRGNVSYRKKKKKREHAF
jgi:hypothetical protein